MTRNPLLPARTRALPFAPLRTAATGAATGLVPGALVLGAQQLGGVVGMPGAAVRYVLLTALLLTLAALPAVRRLAAPRHGLGSSAARCAVAGCLAVAAAGALPSVAVFCATVPTAALLGAAALGARRSAVRYPAVLAGLAGSAALLEALPDRPETALLLSGATGALLLAPDALTRRTSTSRTAENGSPGGMDAPGGTAAGSPPDDGRATESDGGRSPASDGGPSPASETTWPPAPDAGQSPGPDGGRSPAPDAGPSPALETTWSPAPDAGQSPALYAGPSPASETTRSPAPDAGRPPAPDDRPPLTPPPLTPPPLTPPPLTPPPLTPPPLTPPPLTPPPLTPPPRQAPPRPPCPGDDPGPGGGALGRGSERIPRAALGAAAAVGVLAALDLYTFRFTLLGADPAGHVAPAAAAAAVAVLAAHPVLRPAGAAARRAAALTLAGAAAALLAQAAAPEAAHLTLALGALLTCVALTGRLLDAQTRDRRPGTGTRWTIVGALAGIGLLAGAGRLVDAGDALALCALPPLAGTLALARTARTGSASTGAGEPFLRLHDVTVRHQGRTVIRRLRLTAAAGEVLVLRDERSGRRAAALLKVLAGHTRPAAGRCRLHGQDLRAAGVRTRWLLGLSAALDPSDAIGAGLLPQLASDRTVREALRAAAASYGPGRAAELEHGVTAAFPALRDRLDDPPRDLEPAERCVLGLAQALLARPRLLLLDLTSAPSAALADDPHVAVLVRRVAAQGTAVLVATAGSGAALLDPRVLDLTERRPARTRARTKGARRVRALGVPAPDGAADLQEGRPA